MAQGSTFDLSLIKAPYGTGTNAPASIDGWPFRIDPSSAQLPIKAKMAKYTTLGGFVVQVYGTTWGDLKVSGQFGVGGWREQRLFLDRMVHLGTAQALQGRPTYADQNFTPGKPFRFKWPLLDWDFLCYLKGFTSPDGPQAVHLANDNINPKYTLTLFIVTDNGSIAEIAKNAYLQRLAPGLGVMWDTGVDKYQGYSDSLYNNDSPSTNADVQLYINGASAGSSETSGTPANLSGVKVGPTPIVTGAQTTTPITSAMQDAVNIIIGIGKSLGIPQYGWAIAIAVAMDESTLGSSTTMNNPADTGGSLGPFQQFPNSGGWGTVAQVEDLATAAESFYGAKSSVTSNTGLMQISGWESMELTEAAHAVQGNKVPGVYEQYATEALQLAAAGANLPAVPLPYPATVTYKAPPSGGASAFVAEAKSLIGKPSGYGAGQGGPDSFDCSGLVQYSLIQVGVASVPRTSETQFTWCTPITEADLQAGDLIFEQWSGDESPPGHVIIYDTDGYVIEAPGMEGTVVHRRLWSDTETTIVGYGRVPGF